MSTAPGHGRGGPDGRGGGGEQAMVPEAGLRSYYGQPVLKPPVWRWPVPAYFFAGGLAGASATLAWAARLSGNHPLARRALLASAGGVLASPALLIEDLGRPERFANMLRVAKPTSPMSTGAWVLAAMGPSVVAATASDLTGVAPRAGRAMEWVAGILGPVLATYTAVLVSDTAVPAWHDARRELPFVFGAGAAASAGAAATVLTPVSNTGPARRLAVGGALAELAATRLMERELGPDIGAPYRQGQAGRLSRWATALTGGGAALLTVARRRRALNIAGAAAVLAGAAVQRFAVMEAGRASALDPAATVGPQRLRLGTSSPSAPSAPAQPGAGAGAMRPSPA